MQHHSAHRLLDPGRKPEKSIPKTCHLRITQVGVVRLSRQALASAHRPLLSSERVVDWPGTKNNSCARALRQAETGTKVKEIVRKLGPTDPSTDVEDVIAELKRNLAAHWGTNAAGPYFVTGR